MSVRLVLSVFVGFMIASTCAFFIPSLRMVTGPVLCPGGDLVQELPISNKRLNLFCQRNNAKEAVGLFAYLSVGMLIYGIGMFALTFLFRFKKQNLATETNQAAKVQSSSPPQGHRIPDTIPSDPTRSVMATGTVVSVREGDSASKKRLLRWIQLVIVLNIEPPTGEPFEATVRWHINELHFSLVQVGCSFPVSLNQDDLRQVSPATDWAYV